jgi:hypothetical protein
MITNPTGTQHGYDPSQAERLEIERRMAEVRAAKIAREATGTPSAERRPSAIRIYSARTSSRGTMFRAD